MSTSRNDMVAHVVARNIKDPSKIQVLGAVPNNDLRNFNIVRRNKINTDLLTKVAAKLPNQEDWAISIALLPKSVYQIKLDVNEQPLDSKDFELEESEQEVTEQSSSPTTTVVELDSEVPEELAPVDEGLAL